MPISDCLVTTVSQAQIEQWIEFSTHEIDPPLCSWYYAVAGYFPYEKKVSLPSRGPGLGMAPPGAPLAFAPH